ncbi:MAG: hypothetical protein WC838_00425 [Candidatus Margulisiibacteriota bacterium]
MSNSVQGQQDIFKKCSCCHQKWRTETEFLSDPGVQFAGYQENFQHMDMGYILFNHCDCGTTIALQAAQFGDLYRGPIFIDSFSPNNKCPEYCLLKDDCLHCTEGHECGYAKKIIQGIVSYPKKQAEEALSIAC